MIREQKIMKDLVDKIGDEFDDYISHFDKCDIWEYKEGELVVNKTFKDILDIIASYNLTTANQLLKDGAYDLTFNVKGKEEELLGIFRQMSMIYLKSGSDCILNRTMLFCFNLYLLSNLENKKPSELINEIYNSDIIGLKNSVMMKLKYNLNMAKYPYKIIVDSSAITLISLLNGKRVEDCVEDILEVMI